MRYFDRHRKRLTKHHYIRGTLKSVSGEQEVKIEDSAGVPFNKVEIAGNTSQKQYQGYQQIGFKDFTNSYTDTDGNVLDVEVKDGVVTLNGKTNSRLIFTFDYTNMTNRVLEAGTYTFTGAWVREAGENGIIGNGGGGEFRYDNIETQASTYAAFGERTVITFESNVRIGYIKPSLTTNQDLVNAKFAIGVFKGDVATADFPPYETYVGGIPSPNPGQIIHHYKDEEKETDISSMLSNSTCLTDQWGYVAAFDTPFIPDANATSVKFSVQNFRTGNSNDMLLLAQNAGDLYSGINCITIACGDGTTSEIIIDPQEYPDGIYIGVGETHEGMQGNTDYYVQLAIGAGIIATETISTLTSTTEIPAYPQEIVNTNKEGMSVVLRNPNLLQFKDCSGSKTDSDGNVLTWEMKDGIVTVNGKTNAFTVISLDSKSFVQEVYEPGTYSFTASYYNPENPLIRGCDWLFRYADDNTSRIDGYTEGSTPSRRVATKTIDKPFRLGYAQLYIYANTEYKNFKYTIGLFKGSYTAETMPPYSTYFREEIAIPTGVEVEGATVDLRLAHIPNLLDWRGTTATDYLKVDKVANKVEYVQGIGKVILDNNTEFSYSTARPNVFSALPFLENTVNFGNSAYCNKYQIYIGVGNILNLDYAFSTDGRYYGGQLSLISIKDIRFDNVADFKADLEQSPIEILYCLETPITHDITSTELGQALLRLCVDRGLDGTLRVESELGISSLSCDYYSQENEEKVLLTVSYQNEAGDALMDDKTHNVRRGSKYQIVSPQIDGYEPSEKEVFGIADGDLTIILKYKEVSDVTV